MCVCVCSACVWVAGGGGGGLIETHMSKGVAHVRNKRTKNLLHEQLFFHSMYRTFDAT